MRRLLIAGLALAIVTAACGDDDAGPAPSTSTTATPVTQPAASPPSTTTTSSVAAPPTTEPTETGLPAVTTTTSTTTAPPSEPSSTTTTDPPAPTQALDDLTLATVRTASGLDSPVLLTAPRGDHRLFVVEQPGRILVIDNGTTEVFLDISERVQAGGERGLLGLAFHPGYVENRRFFVNYTDGTGTTTVSEFTTDALQPNRAESTSERVLLTVPQPAANHNGGMIEFGPDGYLYIGLGDGGGANDRYGNGQRPDTLLGAILRLDVDTADPYAIPSTNPFELRAGGAPEVWAWGLRNPWRFSFDGERIFIGDVGQNEIEEIDIATVGTPGVNFGWPVTEGFDCFRADTCDRTDLTDPVFTYRHDSGNCSVTGGYVYRGTAIPDLVGTYLFGDFCSGRITGFRIDGEGVYQVRDWTSDIGTPRLTSFGRDGFGELYLVSQSGEIRRIVRSET